MRFSQFDNAIALYFILQKSSWRLICRHGEQIGDDMPDFRLAETLGIVARHDVRVTLDQEDARRHDRFVYILRCRKVPPPGCGSLGDAGEERRDSALAKHMTDLATVRFYERLGC